MFSQEVNSRGAYGPDLLPIADYFPGPKFHVRVCGNCGLVEWFVPEQHLTKVKERFRPEA